MIPDVAGLSSEDVEKRQKHYGQNILPEKPPPSNFQLIINQLKSPLIYVLILAGFVTLGIGHYPDSIIIFLSVCLNTALGFVQEKKASNALHALKHFVTSKATVVRNGLRITTDTTQIVPGDLVVLSQGLKVPADGKLIHCNRLYVDESVLTGESVPVQKTMGEQVFMGTTISSGQGLMEVQSIAALTKMGEIALQVQEKESDTPLQKQLKKFSKQLLLIIGILTVVVFVSGLALNIEITDIFTTSVALAVSSIPEGLIVSLTAVLAIGMHKILKRRGLVRQLSAAETLGGVTVICVDKTGTLTQGKMKVVDYVGDKKEIAQQVLLANDLDDPIVIAAFEWGRSIISDFISKHPRLDSIPFSPHDRFFMSLHKWNEGANKIYVNGAPEIILEWTNMSDKEKKETLFVVNDLTAKGNRLMGLVCKEVPGDQKVISDSENKTGFKWVGLLAFSDPVRQGVKEALDESKEAGIRTVVITGDYAKTSEFVLGELGMTLAADEIITGKELSSLSVDELAKAIKTTRLFARTTPSQKLKIVEALKINGDTVAMMGDGVNDAPALHAADIGIAVGEATDVAKESADLIILDSNFSTIIAAIEEGRVMFENIRKIILYLLSDAFAEIILVMGGILMGLPLPMTAMQILWINLVSDGLPNLSLTIDPKRANIMKEKPRSPRELIVSKWMISLIAVVSVTAGLVTLVSFVVVYKMSQDIIFARSVSFLTLGIVSLVYVFSIRTLTEPFWKSSIFENRWLVVAVLTGVVLHSIPFTTQLFRDFFGLSKLSPIYWLIVALISVVMFFVVEISKTMLRKSHTSA